MQSSRHTLFLGGASLAAGYLLGRSLTKYSYCGRNVIIAGGSRGLGLVIARQLASEGARVALLARDPDELQSAVIQLQSYGGIAQTYVCDIRDRQQVEATFRAIERDFRKIDVLINNAGIIQTGSFENQNEEDFRQAMETHFYGPLYTIWAALPRMRKSRARIANISSIGGRIASPHLLPYCASKFALRGFSLGLATEMRRRGIRVTTICPSLMRTGSPVAAYFKGQHDLEYGWFTAADSVPIIFVRAEKAARVILDAIRTGRAEVTFPWYWRALALGMDAFPGPGATISGLIDRLLPDPSTEPEGDTALPGYEAKGDYPPDWMSQLSEKAGRRNNEPEYPAQVKEKALRE